MPKIYSSWDFRNGYVDPDNFKTGETDESIFGGEDFVSSESILIAAGPAQFSDIANVYAIGVVQNMNLAQNKNIQQLFEIGSRDTILIPGRTFIQTTISRILFNGPSLLKALYAGVGSVVDPAVDYGQLPGDLNGNLWMNLAATFFNKTIGLAMLMHDSENDVYGGVYLEGCLVQAHNLTLAAGQTVVAENAALRIRKVKPISLSDPQPTGV